MNLYSQLAHEYYDKRLHPTCANFDELSDGYISTRARDLISPQSKILEVGTGRSKVAPLLEDMNLDFEHLTLLDSSMEMLSHSRKWIERGAKHAIADAQATQLGASTFSLVVSSLGDPYNTPQFWREASRLMLVGGTILFTTPAYEWVERFRRLDQKTIAEFVKADGSKVFVDSFVPSGSMQRSMFADAGLGVVEEVEFRVSDLNGSISSKLLTNTDIPILRAFRLFKL